MRLAVIAAFFACSLGMLASPAFGQDLTAAIAETEARAAVAGAEIGQLEAALDPIEKRAKLSGERAAPKISAARAAHREVSAIERGLSEDRRSAAREVATIEAERQQAAANHDTTVWIGFGIGLAALALAVVALNWERIRTSWRVGASLPSVPGWARYAATGTLVIVCLVGLGVALFSDEGEHREVSSRLSREAEDTGAGAPALIRARRTAKHLDSQAASLRGAAGADLQDLRAARRKLARAEARLAAAERDADEFSRKLVALTQREEREAEENIRQEKHVAQEAVERVEQEEAERCDPNYSGCLDPNAVDYDCEGGSGNGPLYTGTVEVRGYDHYGLDDDGDGIGCEAS